MTSILEDVLKHLPATTEDMVNDEVFTPTIINHITSGLLILNQNGVGRYVDLVADQYQTWDNFFYGQTGNIGIPAAKNYLYTHVQILFDPPQPSVLSVLEKTRDEYLWRARLEFDK